jgi:D-alanine-D-alanine ligase
MSSVEGRFGFPLIAKPVDDGCSSAVLKIQSKKMLDTYLKALFRQESTLDHASRESLGLGWNEEFPKKTEVLIERLISDEGAVLFMEITCGLMTEYKNGKKEMTVFEPSEALASGDILSLEEKFLAGQGLNITPARLYTANYDYDYISSRVKEDLKKAANILGIEGYARIDAFVRVFEDGKVETVIIEVNSLPGMTPATYIYHQAALEGLKPYEFIDKILTFADERQQRITK